MHDDRIETYNVNFKEQSLCMILHNDTENCDTHFLATDVLSHCFENVLSANIILSIDEQPIGRFIPDNKETLLAKQVYCWPMHFHSLHELENYLLQNKYKYITICSSWGLCGWILAKNYYVQRYIRQE